MLYAGMMCVNAQVHIGNDDELHGRSILDLSNAGNLGMLLPQRIYVYGLILEQVKDGCVRTNKINLSWQQKRKQVVLQQGVG
jgi:hypothetical protein